MDNKFLQSIFNKIIYSGIISVEPTHEVYEFSHAENYKNLDSCAASNQILHEDIGNSKDLDEQITAILKTLNSTNIDIDTKLCIINYHLNCILLNKVINDDGLGNIIVTPELLELTESLLNTYCEIAFSRDSTNERNPLHNSKLKLLNPILQLLMFTSTMPITEIRAIFIDQTDILTHLMAVFSYCAMNAHSSIKTLIQLTYKKQLIGKMCELSNKETKLLFENCFGVMVATEKFQLQGYKLKMFDICHEYDMNINEEVTKRKKANCIFDYRDNDNSDTFSEDRVEWMQIVVGRILSYKHVLVYCTDKWDETIRQISLEINKHISALPVCRSSIKYNVGDIVGFRSNNVTFEGFPPLYVQCLRGQVLAVTSDCVMLWAMDTGLIGFSSIRYIHHIASTETLAQPALIKICELEGVICDVDLNFFLNTTKLLQLILISNSKTGKHMLLSEYGSQFLALLEYPSYSVRIAVMDILQLLAGSGQDVVKFMEKLQFHTFLSGKLERYAHAYKSEMYISKTAFNKETLVMTKILACIFQEVHMTTWVGLSQAVRALKILYDTNGLYWKSLIVKCLGLLSNQSKVQISERRSIKEIRHDSVAHSLLRDNLVGEGKSEYILSASSLGHKIVNSSKLDLTYGLGSATGNVDFLLLGSKIKVLRDLTHEVMERLRLNIINETEVAEVLCGLLNSNVESSLYFGIDADSRVTGVVLSHNDKSEFKEGIDRIMRKCLLPEVRTNSYDVIFTPVLKSEDKVNDISLIHLFVVEVCVRPLMHVVYTVLHGPYCYIRHSNRTIDSSAFQKKKYIMEEEEKSIDDAIRNLYKNKDNYCAKLAELEQEYFSNILIEGGLDHFNVTPNVVSKLN